MKLRGVTSVLAAGVAVSLVWLVGASGEDPALEAVPAAMAVRDLAPPAPGADRQARDAVREAFGEEFADPLAEEIVLPGDEFLTFDPYNAPTPIVIQPDGTTDEAILVPLPTAPATIAVAEVEAVGVEKKGALLSQPVKGRSTSRFGMRYHPILRVYKLHTGHDWATPCGTPVGAAADGTVVRTGWAGGNGVQVKIDHGTIRGFRVVTTYNHLSSIGVKVGQKVKALQGVGRVGNTGYSTGCHLHFELIVNGNFTDPLPWLNGEPTVVDLTQMDNVIVVPQSPQPTLPAASLTPSLPESPSASASESPSASPSASLSPSESATDSESPSASPSDSPASPSSSPSSPSSSPSSPSASPSSPVPTSPSPSESSAPAEPSTSPTTSPSTSPSTSPTTEPSSPTAEPTTEPTQAPSPDPTTPLPPPPPTTSEPAPSPTQTSSQPTATATTVPPAADPPATDGGEG